MVAVDCSRRVEMPMETSKPERSNATTACPSALVICTRWDGRRPLDPEGDHLSVDLFPLVGQLLLNDHVVLQSSMRDVEAMVKAFGLRHVLDLFAAGCLSVYCDYELAADLSRDQQCPTRFRTDPLPPFSYHFGTMHPEGYVERGLRKIDAIAGLTLGQSSDLKKTIVGRLVEADRSVGRRAIEQLRRDVVENRPYVRSAIEETLRRVDSPPRIEGDWTIRFHEATPNDFVAETDLAERIGDAARADALISSGLLALADLNIALETMARYNVRPQLSDSALCLIEPKVGHLLGSNGSRPQRDQLLRVLSLRRLIPDEDQFNPAEVDIAALLRYRQTAECLSFRTWLSRIDVLSDHDVQLMFDSVRARVGSAAATALGRVAKFIALSAAGLAVAGPVAGVALGALDTFVLNKLLQTPEPIVFVNNKLPSIFRRHTSAPRDRSQLG
jgi:hypothetical protein